MSPRTFRYFAYGSNMLTRRLTAADRAPSATRIGIGYAEGRRLSFDKVSSDGSGKCDAEFTGKTTDRVHGVLFEIPTRQKPALDKAEGLGVGYGEESIDIVFDSRTVHAVAYIATKKSPILRPYHWYKAIVIAGAVEHRLPEPYLEWLRTIESVEDPEADRRADNEALLLAK